MPSVNKDSVNDMKNGENLTISNPRKIAIRMLNCANVDMVCWNSYSLTAVKRYQNRKLLAHNAFLEEKIRMMKLHKCHMEMHLGVMQIVEHKNMTKLLASANQLISFSVIFMRKFNALLQRKQITLKLSIWNIKELIPYKEIGIVFSCQMNSIVCDESLPKLASFLCSHVQSLQISADEHTVEGEK
ncbi:hypothetical protein T03_12264 [Trichinella britovi]|uniref:Uncharacterized protein n=1 Tax=Trichinella britovi TaxID=45882 RepID=A0A0V1D330_TRIBR|nr:hypothetical protein T03_12264 [Trichinella britovi]